jgi:hypothetical protein
MDYEIHENWYSTNNNTIAIIILCNCILPKPFQAKMETGMLD